MKRLYRSTRDFLWPMLDPPSRPFPSPSRKLDLPASVGIEVLREVYGRLSAEFAVETDRMRAVENKLLAVGSVAPIAVTIIVAVVSVLFSGRLPDLSPASVTTLVVLAFYAALQFLRAMLAAILGLSAKSYNAPGMSDIAPDASHDVTSYLCKASNGLARRLDQHREVVNSNVSQLKLAHHALRNAVRALVFFVFILGALIICVAWECPAG